MKINKVLGWYYKAYYATAEGQEKGRTTANAIKGTVGEGKVYKRIKGFLLNFAGRFYWPSTHPTGIDQPTAEFLYSLVRMHNPRTCLEIGTAKGNSAIAIGQALQDNGGGVLVTLDPEHQPIVPVAIRKSKLENRIRYFNGYSYNWLEGKHEYDFVFIDGDHSYENVKRDWELVKNNLSDRAMVVFHDTVLFEGPKKVVESIEGYEKMTFATENGVGITVIKKIASGERGIWKNQSIRQKDFITK